MNALTGHEAFFSSDSYLIPTLEDDPLLGPYDLLLLHGHIGLTSATEAGSDDWTDSEQEDAVIAHISPSDLDTAQKKILALEKKLKKAHDDLKNYRAFVGDRLNLSTLAEALKEEPAATHVNVPLRDDDSHYFQSYGENGDSYTTLFVNSCAHEASHRYPCRDDSRQSQDCDIC